MRSGAFPLIPWGLAIFAVATFGRIVYALEWLPYGLLGGAGLAAALWGAVTGVLGRGGRRPFADETPRVVSESSWSTIALAAGVTLGATGTLAIGQAFAYLGVVLALLGLGGLVREGRAHRQALDAATEAPR